MSGARDLRSLVAQNGHLSVKAGRRQNWNELTTNGVFAGLVTSSSLLAISHSSASVSTAWSISPSTKLHTFFSTLVRVFSVVESSTQMNASCSTYILLISSYLHLS